MNKLVTEAVKAYVLYNSPLTTTRGKFTLGIILIILFAVAVTGRYMIGIDTLLTTYSWVWWTSLGSLMAYLVFRFLDRKRSLPWFRLLVILAVAFQMCFVAAVFNTKSPFPLQTVGFVEEFSKILPVLLLALFLPNLIKTKKDGMIYGGLAGIGFNIMETGVYIAHTLPTTPLMEVLWLQSSRFAIWGFGTHVIWSMFVGLGPGMAMESTKNGLAKWRPFVLIYLLTAVMHSLYDSILLGVFLIICIVIVELVSGKNVNLALKIQDMAKPGIGRNAMIIEHLVYNIVIIFVLIKQMIKSALFEQQLYVDELHDEKSDVITKEEKKVLAKESRWGYRRYKNYSGSVSHRIVKLQNLLAMQKHTLRKDKEPIDKNAVIKLLRQEIITLRKT